MSTSKKFTLLSSDREKFEVDESVANQSETIKLLMDDGCANDAIPLPNVSSKILGMIIEYCKKHAEEEEKKKNPSSLKTWDAEFVRLDQNTLRELLLAANYLNVKSLLDLVCRTVADMIKGKTPEEVREILDIKNDFTPEEEAAARKQVEWAGL